MDKLSFYLSLFLGALLLLGVVGLAMFPILIRFARWRERRDREHFDRYYDKVWKKEIEELRLEKENRLKESKNEE